MEARVTRANDDKEAVKMQYEKLKKDYILVKKEMENQT